MNEGERRIVVVGYPDSALLDIACVTETLDTANLLGAQPPYATRLAGPGGRPISCSGGLSLTPHLPLEHVVGAVDTILVTGGHGHEAAARDERVVGQVRRIARDARRVASVCTGASILAATGLLDGRRATTHWAYAVRLARSRPAVRVDPAPLYIRDGRISTSAGVTAALDLTLSFVEEDHGPEAARTVARALVTYLQRPGNQAQVSMFVAAPPPEHPLVRRVTAHVTGHLGADLSAPALAREVGVSTRHLSRLFEAHLGTTPGRYVREARTEAAARLLGSTRLALPAIARRCGFGTTETLRQAFADRYACSPSAYRRSLGEAAGEPDAAMPSGAM
ncbi:DJ-1/PfpI family protein [Streptomyces sp. SID3343]|uniref:GlxA family transcriptional regulator n=1 Tax=Streptomyces sp. SID3343 TaxID=2690260 RepID=UPI00136CB7E1|nr:DJ-1/PfpI family protein [Streptomyces sp. SID3343]MYV97053.1 helix-turn-helix domain-containing protein [Streptomyces sp. SID3343]